MKKSKFLKKSLAMLLAVMLVVAMIPLSAAAAYEPADGLTPVVGADDKLTPVDGGWDIVFAYSTTLPTITFRTGDSNEKISYIDKDQKTANGTNGIPVWEDKDGNPVDIVFWVVKGDETSERYTISWEMEAASTDVSVKSAKIGDYTGVVNEGARTITFTLPFGYAEKNSDDVDAKIVFEGASASTDEQTVALDDKIGTNMRKAEGVVVEVQPQYDVNDISYTVTAQEEEGLTSLKIGDYVGQIKTATTDSTNSELNKDYDKGYEDGNIEFSIPADAEAEDFKEVAVAFEVGSNFTGLTIEGVNLNDEDEEQSLTSGEKYNFSSLVSGDKTLTITNANGTRTYQVKFVKDSTDTTIDSFNATGKNSDGENVIAVDGTVNGSALTVELPYNADMNQDLVLNFVGPKDTGVSDSDPSVTIGKKNAVFGTDGKAAVTLTGGTYDKKLSVKVVAENGTTQKFYDLTVTKAEAAFNDPKITSAKITLNKGTEDEAEYTASISGTTITFTLPHSTVDVDLVKDNGDTDGDTIYTFAKTSMTKLDDRALEGTPTFPTFKDGSYVTVSTDNGTTVRYTVKFERKAAETGKTISDFVLSTENGYKGLMEYNGNVNYDVTASGGKFKVTLPTTPGALYPDFTLSTGAKLYAVNASNEFGAISAYNTKTGAAPEALNPAEDDVFYIVADETLATIIENSKVGDAYTVKFDEIEHKNASNYTKYEFEVTSKDQTGDRLTALSAKDGKITAKIVAGDKIELTLPYGYSTGNTFYFDYTISQGATIKAVCNEGSVEFFNNGLKQWSDDKVTAAEADGTDNPDFKVITTADEDNPYQLQVLWSDGTYKPVTKITVTPQAGTAREYTISKYTVNEANTGAAITSLKVNGVAASISGKKITANLPFGTNLGQVKVDITASEMATVYNADGTEFNPEDNVYDLTSPIEFKVVSENGEFTNVYTLTATTAAQFSDVNTGDWFYQNVMDAVAAGIVSGRGDGTFGPNDRITRRDFAIMVSKLLLDGEDAPEATTTPFSDVSADDYALNAIAYCAENGIISGFDGEFRPGDNITRQEAASVMKNALELTGTTSELFADDAAIATWAKANVYACKAAGVFNGDDNNNFNPTSTLTRAEAASIMVNAMK